MLANPPVDLNNLAVLVTQGGLVDGSAAWLAGVPNHVIVRMFDGAGVLVDRGFSVAVFDLT
jgi:hypothetical protein